MDETDREEKGKKKLSVELEMKKQKFPDYCRHLVSCSVSRFPSHYWFTFPPFLVRFPAIFLVTLTNQSTQLIRIIKDTNEERTS